MAWIESHTVIIRHRKLLQLASALSLQPVQVVGHLHALWHSVLEQQEDGDLTQWTDEMIATAAAYDGDPGLFVAELQSKKWLDDRVVHDWLDYAGRYLANKYRTHNPLKLKHIYKVHKVRPKVGLRSDFSQTLVRPKVGLESDNQPYLPNQPNLTKRTYGEFSNVLLSDPELEKLNALLGIDPTKAIIEELSTGIESKGYKYRSHYATLLSWAKRRPKQPNPAAPYIKPTDRTNGPVLAHRYFKPSEPNEEPADPELVKESLKAIMTSIDKAPDREVPF